MPMGQVDYDNVGLYLDKLVTGDKPVVSAEDGAPEGPQTPTPKTGLLNCLTLSDDTLRVFRNEAYDAIAQNLKGSQGQAA